MELVELSKKTVQKKNLARRIVVSEFASLDGVMGEPTWTFAFPNTGDLLKFKLDELFASDPSSRASYLRGFRKSVAKSARRPAGVWKENE